MVQFSRTRWLACRALMAPPLLVALGGCGATLTGTGTAAGVVQGQFDPRATGVSARSPQLMSISQRPSRVFRARIESVGADGIDISTAFSSADPVATSGTSFYFDLTDDRGHRASDPQITEGTPNDRPASTTFQYEETVVDETYTNSHGEVTGEATHDEQRTGVATEHYFTRRARLHFARNDLMNNGATALVLHVRDLVINADLTWTLDGSGGPAGGGYAGPPQNQYGNQQGSPYGNRYNRYKLSNGGTR